MTEKQIDVDALLEQNQNSDLLRLSTAGSVDDGKSTLIGRLLSDSKSIYEDQLEAVYKDSRSLNREEVDLALLMDGLKAEREQGITIDVAYRYFSTPRRRFIIADTPGHEQYTRNMATGASTTDLAIVLIDARHGVITQSKRHAFIASLLGIPHMVVAVNKMDLVDYSEEVYDEICRDYAGFVAKLNVPDIRYIPISALRGDNVVDAGDNMPWYHGMPLLGHLENVQTGSDRNLVDFRFPIQYVNRPTDKFRGYCGTVASGVVRVGSEVMALPSKRTTKVKSIVTYDGDLDHAFPPQSVTICLEDEIDLSRGDMLVHPGNQPYCVRTVESMVVWMSETPLEENRTYLIKHCCSTVRGVFTQVQYRVNADTLHREDVDSLALNEIGRVDLELFKPMICDDYARNRSTGGYVIIDPLSNATVGAGMVMHRSRSSAVGGGPSATSGSVSKNLSTETSLVSADMRAKVLGQKPATIWLTGLSGSGKSTVARHLEKELTEQGHACYVLDGDNVRHGLNRDLGFSADERTENIRRIAEVARLFNDAGLIVITAFISPFRSDREGARAIVGSDKFVEVLVGASLEVCEKRDAKGLYAKARTGEIPSFTGISSPYEAPDCPEITLDSAATAPEDLTTQITTWLRDKGLLR
jgi:bifunctional enzyme CysN/CysC